MEPGIPVVGRPIVYLYEDRDRLRDPRIHPLILNSGYIHYPIGRTDRHGNGKTKENPKENYFKLEISLEKTLRKKMKGILKILLYENDCRTGMLRTMSNMFR